MLMSFQCFKDSIDKQRENDHLENCKSCQPSCRVDDAQANPPIFQRVALSVAENMLPNHKCSESI